MTTNTDGGPAFPFAATDGSNEHRQTNGMSLRDWFAGQALTGFGLGALAEKDTINLCASTAYVIADAMLAARKGGE